MDFRNLRKKEFSRLDKLDQVYLDYTGSGLYSEWQIDRHFKYLSANVLGNPHTFSPSSLISTEEIDLAREKVHEHFNADKEEYAVIFTQNATASLKLVGESYPFRNSSTYVLFSDNHNSVNGIREFSLSRGAKVVYVPLNFNMNSNDLDDYLPPVKEENDSLFAFPAQSNFSGARYPLEWIDFAHSRGYDVLLDAAAYVPTNNLDLGKFKPDFVPVSFYKMFGYPTGVGALIAKLSTLKKLRKPWFSGGTIDIVTTQYLSYHLVGAPQAFEDGTPSFLGISAIPIGLEFLKRVGMENIHTHVINLSMDLIKGLKSLKHENGNQLIEIYGPTKKEMIGSAVSFNVLTPRGKVIDSRLIGKITKENNISVRTGCFCNPGSGELFFGYTSKDEKRCFKDISNGASGVENFAGCLEAAASGAVRASLGIATNKRDISRLIDTLSTLKNCSEEVDEEQDLPALSC